MAEILNLNRARKELAKAEAKARAQANRAAHGRTKAEKLQSRTAAERAARTLDQARLERPEE